MFNLQGGELIIILLLALVVLGPEKLPDAMRKAGQFYAELKKMSSGFQEEFKSVVDEPMREMRDTANLLRDSADFSQFEAGEREEKPKSAEMVAAADPNAIPAVDVPTFEPGPADELDAESDHGGESEPEMTDRPAEGGRGDEPDRAAPPEPFSGTQLSSAAPSVPDEAPSPSPEPFSGTQEFSAAPSVPPVPDAAPTADRGAGTRDADAGSIAPDGVDDEGDEGPAA